MPRPTLNRPLAGYIVAATYLSCIGWLLSAFRALTPFALAMALAIGFVIAAMWCWLAKPRFHFRLFPHRWKRLFPALYFVVVVLVFLSGAFYPESFQDALSYKIPRCLQWLHERGWYWIPTYDNRQNNRGCVFEWMSLPILALLRTDKFLFLINYAALLLFPSLIFQTLRLLGIAGRTAWMWMWIWPTAMGFICQSATGTNDFLGGFFVLAAINFGLLYSRSHRHAFFYLSILAFSLATGIKALNLLIAPAWLISMVPGLWKGELPAPRRFAVVALAAMFSSFIPNALINWKVSGDILAMSFEPNVFKPPMSPLLRGLVSGVMMCVKNFYPPYFPAADQLNLWSSSFLTTNVGAYLGNHFEDGIFWTQGDYANPDDTGLGLFLSLLVVASLVYGVWHRSVILPWSDWKFYIPLTSLLSLGFFLSQSMLAQIARLAIPYYTLVLPLLLYSPIQAQLTRRSWWRVMAVLPMAGAIFFLLTWPMRPVLPMATILRGVEKITGPSYFTNLVESMYAKGIWTDAGADWINHAVPPEVRRVGLIREWFEPEATFWEPIGARRVITVAQSETPESIRQHGLTYIVASQLGINDLFGMSSDDWVKKFHGRITSRYQWRNDTWLVIVLSVYVPPPNLQSGFDTESFDSD